jgi:hypothetical protein
MSLTRWLLGCGLFGEEGSAGDAAICTRAIRSGEESGSASVRTESRKVKTEPGERL